MEWNTKSPTQWDWENLMILNETPENPKNPVLEIEGEKGNNPKLEDSKELEPFLGLKLGKRTYFKDVLAGNNAKSSLFSVTPESSISPKKSKSGDRTAVVCCEVEGCNLDLSSAKGYYRKHRVCESHSKFPKVIVAGLERRFCQQCSRFHSLSEFDENKRSCRRRLSDHNARRRKPQPGTARLSSSLYDDRKQTSVLWNRPNAMEGISTTPKFTITKDYNSRSLLPFKPKVEVFNQGIEESMASTSVGSTQDFHRALSLLSTTSWDSSDPKPTHYAMPQPQVRTQARSVPQNINTPQGVPFSPINSQNEANNYFQEFPPQRSPYDSGFYSTHLD